MGGLVNFSISATASRATSTAEMEVHDRSPMLPRSVRNTHVKFGHRLLSYTLFDHKSPR
jgi:hypothetical protein